MKPKSQTLFHFTKNLDFVKNILTDGFWPRYCLEDFSWYIHNIDYIAFPMVCFCDIPLSRIKEHVGFYGEYGVGVTKEWAIANRLNPVSYLSRTSNYGSAVNNLFKNIDITGQKAYYENAGLDLNMLLSHYKPLTGNMIINGSSISKDFYQENEWRFVPQRIEIGPWLTKLQFETLSVIDDANSKTKNYSSLKLTPQDVRYIFVKSDSDIPEMINFIQSSLDHFSNVDLKILMSRIISLESISEDL